MTVYNGVEAAWRN